MGKTILIKNGRVIDPSVRLDSVTNLLIKDGIVDKIGDFNLGNENIDETIDATGLVVATGLVDMHVHLRDPGQTHKETLQTGCNSAASGGVTSLLAMPNTTPAIDSKEVVEDILNRSKGLSSKVYLVASITKGLKSQEPTNWQELANAGAIALSDDGRPVENTKILADAMATAPTIGMSVVAHCEDLFLANGGKMNEGEISKKLGVKGLPKAAEDTGTAREIALASCYNVPVHICHVSTAHSVALIRDAKARGVKVTSETAPHYFSLTEKELLKKDADYRMNPPLRQEVDVEAIIKGLLDGTLDAIATDHAPHSVEEKSDFENAPNGSIGMESSLAATLTYLYHTKKMSLIDIIDKMSTAPAKILNIKAGSLQVGCPADIVIFNENEEWVVDTNKLHGKSKNTPFKGMTLKGKVKMTLLDGRVVFDER